MFVRAIMLAAACMAGAGQPEPVAQPASDLRARLAQVDARAAAIEDLTATFEQRKHTALLREPMVSSGTVRVRAGRVLWETRKPRPSTLAIEEERAIVLYPRQKAAEIYPLRAEMRLLGASPLPSFARLREAFEITGADAADLVERPDADWIGLALAPKPGPMRDHIERVRALLDPETPAVVALEITDADGDRTVIRFTEVRTNTGLEEADVTLKLGEDIEVSYPLGRPEEGSEGEAGGGEDQKDGAGSGGERLP